MGILYKKTQDLSGVSKKRKEEVEKLTEKQKFENKISGIFGQKRIQAMCKRQDLESEIILGRGPDNNAFIVIGNDRTGKPHEGYGALGHTQCDAIDIVAGLGGFSPKEVDSKERSVVTNPNFFIDSARIYISQKTDIDKNFGIAEFGLNQNGVSVPEDKRGIGVHGAKSAVAVKADNVRLIGRESIKLVTGTDKKNSQGGDVLAKTGIELLAMNDPTTLQPIVLGHNLEAALVTIVSNIEGLSKIMHGYIKYQMKYNQALQQHTHNSPFYGIATLPSSPAIAAGIKCDIETAANTELSILKHITNLQGLVHNYLTDSGELYINSRLNKAN
jgi:hypothetical protein